MTSHGTLRELFIHNDWARDHLLALAAGLSDEQLERPFEMGVGTLRNTLHHLWETERGWLDRWLGKSDASTPEPECLPLRDHAQRWRETARERAEFLDRVGPAGESRRITYTNTKGQTFTHRLGDMMLHVTNHGVHHRAQAVNMLRHLGARVPRLDYIFMRIERPSVAYEPDQARKLHERGLSVGQPPETPAAFELDTIREYLRYSEWATERVHAAAGKLSDAQLDRPFEMGLGSLRKTLLHIHDAEQSWLENWTLGSKPGMRQSPPTTSLNELRELRRTTIQTRSAYLDQLSDADLQQLKLAQPAEGIRLTFRLGETVLQVCAHATHHRAQVLNMLRHLDTASPPLDYVIWLRETAVTANV